MASICARTDILQLAVHRFWKEAQAKLFIALRNENRGLIIEGDGRADIPGHCAKYGTYSMIEMQSLSVIDVELIHVCWTEHQMSDCKHSTADLVMLLYIMWLMYQRRLNIKFLASHVQIRMQNLAITYMKQLTVIKVEIIA